MDPVRFKPQPPALLESKSTLNSLKLEVLKLCTIKSRSEKGVLPSNLQKRTCKIDKNNSINSRVSLYWDTITAFWQPLWKLLSSAANICSLLEESNIFSCSNTCLSCNSVDKKFSFSFLNKMVLLHILLKRVKILR